MSVRWKVVQNRIDASQDSEHVDDGALLNVVNALTKGLLLNSEIAESVNGLREQVEHVANATEQLLTNVGLINDTVCANVPLKEFYTPAEVAEMVGKAKFTVREWCRHQRIHAQKRPTGRGDAEEWEIAHSEVERIRNHGLLPRPTKY